MKQIVLDDPMIAMNSRINNTFFPVAKELRVVDDCEEKKWCVVNKNDDSIISEVSDRYELVRNEDLVAPFIKHFGVDKVDRLKVHGSMFCYEISTGREFSFPGGDLVKERLVITNSYDRTRAFNFMFGAFRLVCKNGLYAFRSVVSFKKKHIGDIPVKNIVGSVMKGYSKNGFESWKRLADIQMTEKEEIKILDRIELFGVDKKTKDAQKKLPDNKQWGNFRLNNLIVDRAKNLVIKPESQDNQRNAWGLFNQINQAIDNTVNKKDFNKIIQGNRSAERYLLKTFNLN